MKDYNATGAARPDGNLHMPPIVKNAPSDETWGAFLRDRSIWSGVLLFLLIAEFGIFKLCYPYPDFFSDSYSYIIAASEHLNANIWPIGYSKFLAVFHWFTHSAVALNFFQFLFLELAAMYFGHTIEYFFHTGDKTRIFMNIFLYFNPLFLYLANYVTTDALFVGLSIIWATQLIWVIKKPSPYQFIIISVVFFIAFTFRYNAMFYPVITALAYFISRQRAWVKAVGIVTGPLLIIPFILFTSDAAKKMTGTAQFPPILGGWQWANNALYMRGFIEEDSANFPTAETRELDGIASRFFAQPSRPQDGLASYVANFFIRQPEAPLKKYLHKHYPNIETDVDEVVAWGKVAPVFQQYGLFLIKRHPLAFLRYYMLVNYKNYLFPPLEKLEIYNVGQDKVWPIAAYWFDFPSLKISVISKSLQGIILLLFPTLFCVLNIYYGWSLFTMFRRKEWQNTSRTFKGVMGIVALFLLLNCCFSVFANIIVIRYQVFPMIVFLVFSMLLTDQLELKKAYMGNPAPGKPDKKGGYGGAHELSPNIL